VVTPTRNGPCPCGSSVKYKKCCLPKQPQEPERPRIVEHRGQRMIASRGVTTAMLDDAAEHFARRRERREGPAAQVMRFAAPLLEAAGNNDERTQHAMTLAMAFWNLALLAPDRRAEMLADLVGTIAADERDANDLRAMAADMVVRHREMFPEMHRGRS
jgi:hypothetical protein